MENIYNITIPFYKKKLPDMFENVLVVFTEHEKTYIKVNLLEYTEISGMMKYDDATRKKRVYDWKKEIPLNKPMIARVEQIITSTYVQVSILNFKKDDESLKLLMKPFIDNKIFINIIKKLCQKFNIDFNEFWTNVIYNININLESIRNNSEEINKLIVDNYSDLSIDLITELNKLLNYKICKLQTKIKLLTNNIINTIALLDFIQIKYEWLNPIKYESDSTYLFESSSENSSIENHNEVIEVLNDVSDSYNVDLFIEFGPKNITIP
jgi:hypothetical protein